MKLPPPLHRPKFAQWRYDRGLTLRQTSRLIEETAERLGLPVRCSHEKVRTLCLPFEDDERSYPDLDLARVIDAMTGGQVLLRHFFSNAEAA